MSTAAIDDYYRAFNERRTDNMLSMLTEDVAHDINQGVREVGRERFAAFLARMDRCYREQIADLVVMGDASGSRFAAEFTVLGTYLETDPGFPEAHGQTYRLPAGAFFELHEGRIARVTTHYNVRDWLLQVAA